MKFKRMFFMLAVIFLMISCSNDRDLESLNSVDLNKIQVVNISDYLSPSTRNRNMSSLKETQVLRFEDMQTYEKTLKELNSLDGEQKVKFFKTLDFKTAELHLNEADEVLDKIFDIEDDDEFLKIYEQYKKSHSYLEYNNDDVYDLSPYLSFNDEKLSQVSNLDGLVVVGNQVLEPLSREVDYIKDDKVEDLGDGLYIKNADDVFVKDESSYSGVAIVNQDVHNIALPATKSEADFALLYKTAPYMSNNYRITVAFENFTSGCCSGVKKNYTFGEVYYKY